MGTTVLKRQFITDADGKPIGVILPLSEYALVEPILAKHESASAIEKLAKMKEAGGDPLFMADLEETMHAFEATDAEWWEPAS